MASGFNNEGGDYSLVSGFNNEGGSSSLIAGQYNIGGLFSLVSGYNNTAPSYAESTLGMFGTNYTPISTNSYNANDRLFSLANGTGDLNRNEALIVYKSGNAILNGDLTVDNIIGDGSQLTNVDNYFSFSVQEKGKAYQGVCADENYIYATTSSPLNTISRYTKEGLFVDELSNYTVLSPLGNRMTFGSCEVDENYIYVSTTNFTSTSGESSITRVAKFNKTTLNFIEEFDVGGDIAGGVAKFEGDFYITYNDQMVIRKYNSSFVFQEEFSLSQSMKSKGGYQSVFFKDGFAYMNWHGANDYGDNEEFGLDKYSFNGSDFIFLENIKSPQKGASQQCYYFDGKYYFNNRINSSILVTDRLGVQATDLEIDSFRDLTTENITAENINNKSAKWINKSFFKWSPIRNTSVSVDKWYKIANLTMGINERGYTGTIYYQGTEGFDDNNVYAGGGKIHINKNK